MLAGGDCTWYRRVDIPDTRSHGWERVALQNVSWQEDHVASVTDRGFVCADIAMAYIPLASLPPGLEIRAEDRLTRGNIEAGTPPEDSAVVTSVAVFSKCGPGLRHVEATCK